MGRQNSDDSKTTSHFLGDVDGDVNENWSIVKRDRLLIFQQRNSFDLAKMSLILLDLSAIINFTCFLS